jgi:hypothetical protein
MLTAHSFLHLFPRMLGDQYHCVRAIGFLEADIGA